MPIPGSGYTDDTRGGYINPNPSNGISYDKTLQKINSTRDGDFFTSLFFPEELRTQDLRTAEIKDFMEIEVLKIVGQGFEQFFDNNLAGSIPLGDSGGREELLQSNENRQIITQDGFSIAESLHRTAKQTGIDRLINDDTENTKLRNQTLDRVAKIWLYEPNNLQTNYSLGYTDTDLTTTKKAFAVIPSALNKQIPGEILKQSIVNLVSVAVNGMAKVGYKDINGETLLGGGLDTDSYIKYRSRSVPTPLMEYLFSGINRRKFSFTWKFYPKNNREVMNVYDIIRTFKKNAHPSRLAGGEYYLKYPNIFKIRHLFINNEKTISENVYLNRIKPCVLDSIDVNYTDSNGYIVFDKQFDMRISETNDTRSTLYNQGQGKAPIGIQLTLNFTELELLLSEDFDPVDPTVTNGYRGGGF